jgi:hypothetical protein
MLRGLGKSMYPLSANANILSAPMLKVNLQLQCYVFRSNVTLACYQQAGRVGQAAETESTLALVESGYIDLPYAESIEKTLVRLSSEHCNTNTLWFKVMRTPISREPVACCVFLLYCILMECNKSELV